MLELDLLPRGDHQPHCGLQLSLRYNSTSACDIYGVRLPGHPLALDGTSIIDLLEDLYTERPLNMLLPGNLCNYQLRWKRIMIYSRHLDVCRSDRLQNGLSECSHDLNRLPVDCTRLPGCMALC